MEVGELGLPLEPAMFPVVLVLKVALKLEPELVTTLHQHMVGPHVKAPILKVQLA
jgi:hypothetical protein